MAPRPQEGRRRKGWRWGAVALCTLLCVRCIATGQLPEAETLSEARQSGLAPGRRLDRQPAPLPTDCRLPWLLTEEESSTLNLQEGCKSAAFAGSRVAGRVASAGTRRAALPPTGPTGSRAEMPA